MAVVDCGFAVDVGVLLDVGVVLDVRVLLVEAVLTDPAVEEVVDVITEEIDSIEEVVLAVIDVIEADEARVELGAISALVEDCVPGMLPVDVRRVTVKVDG